MTSPLDIDGYRPGAVGDIIALHARFYAEQWGFGPAFEAYVARDMQSLLSEFTEGRDLMLFAYENGRAVGSACLDGRPHPDAGTDTRGLSRVSGRVRFIILDPAFAGKGMGKRLVGDMVTWADRVGYQHLWLTTFEGLHAARHLYEANDFTLTDAYPGETYGIQMTEQRFDRRR